MLSSLYEDLEQGVIFSEKLTSWVDFQGLKECIDIAWVRRFPHSRISTR